MRITIIRRLCLPALILAGFCASSSLQGLSCILFTVQERFEMAAVIFSGTVVKVEDRVDNPTLQTKSYHQKITFKVNALWKGVISDTVDIYFNFSPNTGSNLDRFKVGESWIIFGGERTSTVEPIYWPEVKYYFNLCSLVIHMNVAHRVVSPAFLSSIQEPVILNNQNPIELDGFPLADKWWFSDWLDTLYIEYYPWVLHRNLGWIFLESSVVY